MKLINIDTGEKLDSNCSDDQLTEALKVCLIQKKELEQIETDLKSVILDRLDGEQKRFGNFFDIRYTRRKYLDVQGLPKEIKAQYEILTEGMETLKKTFAEEIVTPTIYFPKFI